MIEPLLGGNALEEEEQGLVDGVVFNVLFPIE